MTLSLFAAAAAVVACASSYLDGVSAFSGDLFSRRESLQALVGGVATAAAIPALLFPANAAVTEETPRTVTRMGGLLVRIRQSVREGRRDGIEFDVDQGYCTIFRVSFSVYDV